MVLREIFFYAYLAKWIKHCNSHNGKNKTILFNIKHGHHIYTDKSDIARRNERSKDSIRFKNGYFLGG